MTALHAVRSSLCVVFVFSSFVAVCLNFVLLVSCIVVALITVYGMRSVVHKTAVKCVYINLDIRVNFHRI